MKHFTTCVVILGFFCGFTHCLPPKAFAEEKPITSSLGNPKIKLIGELSLTLPSRITNIFFEKGKDGKYRIGKVLTQEGFYSIDETHQVKTLLDLNNWKNDDGSWVFEENVSYDGQYAIASFWPKQNFESQSIVNLKTLEKTPIKQEGRGWPAFSATSVMLMDAMGSSMCFADFQGNILNHYVLRNIVGTGRGHQFGFFGASPASFFDQSGEILKVYPHISQPQFRVNYDTGQVALHYCVYDEAGEPKESRVGVYNWKGELQHEMTLPFDPNVDLGFSPDGKYAVVAAVSGWVKLLDMMDKTEIWSKDIRVGKKFHWHLPFPITENAGLFAVYTVEPISGDYMITIFSFKGELIGYIQINRRPGIRGFSAQFIPGTSILVFYTDKYLNLYQIEE